MNPTASNSMSMRSSTRPSFFAFVIGLWIISCAIVFASVLVAPPARGQTHYPWSPREARPVESAGEVVLTFTSSDPGRVVYYTSDGDCSRYPLDPSDCGRPQARASEDYGAVKGEWIFTEGGSMTIRIQIFDDDLDEANSEAFGVHASRYDDVAEQTTWSVAIVRIVDDDPRDDSDAPPAAITTVTPADDRPSGSPSVATPPLVTSSSSSKPTDAGNQAGVVNSGDPILEVARSAANEAEPIAAKTVREDNFISMAALRALALATIVAAGFVLRKRLGRKRAKT